jgi:hypothetical protein
MTSVETPVSADSPDPAAPSAVVAEPLAGFALRAVPLAAVGFLIGGWVGLAAAAAGVASTFRRPATLVAAAAPTALVVAALATVIEVPVDGDALRSSFADDRPVAATAGLVAALFALTAVVTLGVRDRVARPAAADVVAPAPVRPDRAAVFARLRPLAPVAGLVLVGAVALALLAPDPPAATEDVAANVRLGRGWGTTADDGAVVVDGTEPPLAVVVAAVAPGGAGAWTALAGAGAMAAVAVFVRRRSTAAVVPLAAAGLVAVGLLVVRADLAAALAAALTGAALLLGDPEGRTPTSALLAGAAYGGAVLAVPVLGLALPLVVAALAVEPRTRAVTVLHGLAGLVGAVVVVAPWQRWLVDRFATWSPAAEVTLPPAGLLAVALTLTAALALPHAPPLRDR